MIDTPETYILKTLVCMCGGKIEVVTRSLAQVYINKELAHDGTVYFVQTKNYRGTIKCYYTWYQFLPTRNQQQITFVEEKLVLKSS